MFTPTRFTTLRALLLAAATASPIGCSDSATSIQSGAGGAGGSAAGAGGSASGASGSSGASGQAGSKPGGCVSGTINSCPCAGAGKDGTQTCLPDGTYGACNCPAGVGGTGGTNSVGGSGGTGNEGGTGGAGGAGTGGKGGDAGTGGKGGAGSGGKGGSAGTGGAGVGGKGGSAGSGGKGGSGGSGGKGGSGGSGGSGGAGGGGGASGSGGSTGCNPVTAEGCDLAAGETCDLSTEDTFECYPAPNDVALCGKCDNESGPFCEPGSHCQGNKCTLFCKTDADCKGNGVCDPDEIGLGGFGVCVQQKTAESDPVPCTVASQYPCENATPVVIQGKDTGYVKCADGRIARRKVAQCPVTAVAEGSCGQDSDCAAGSICVCGEQYGLCEATNCVTSADCAVGDCIEGNTWTCGIRTFACQTASDKCGGVCESGLQDCRHLDSGWTCVDSECSFSGRPLFVEATLRQASLVHGAGW